MVTFFAGLATGAVTLAVVLKDIQIYRDIRDSFDR
jgi:hypothetical protein